MTESKKMLKAGIVGFGYWGPNIVRNFNTHENVTVAAVCDSHSASLKRASQMYPAIKTHIDYREITTSAEIDIVCVVTPVSTHFEIARDALLNGKHIFVEKPFTATTVEAAELIEIASKKGLKIMVDHTFLFTSAVRKIKEVMENGTLGRLYYYDSTRVNLGLFQHDVNVIWDLAPHDFAIMDFLLEEEPVALAATGRAHVNKQEDIAYISVYFRNNFMAHFSVNWLSPVKLRNTLIGGEKKMLVWNDVDPDEKIKIYDKGVDVGTTEGIYKLLVNYRSGDMWAPRIEQTEALKLEVDHYVDCILNDRTPINDGESGMRVVGLLEACGESLRNNGKMVRL